MLDEIPPDMEELTPVEVALPGSPEKSSRLRWKAW